MLKKFTVVVLSLIMVITFIPFSTYSMSYDFTDMPDNWSTQALQNAVKNGLLEGYNNKIKPNDNITRAELATVVNRAFNTEDTVDIGNYYDVNKSNWYHKEMAKAVQMGIFKGYNNKLNPNESITREKAFVVIARILKLEEKDYVMSSLADLGDISDWAKGSVFAMIRKGYVQGYNNKIYPKGNITKAEFAQLMDNIIEKYIKKASTKSYNVDGNLMINEPGVILKDSHIKGDLIIGDGVGDGEVTLINVEVKGRLLTRGGGENSIKIRGCSVYRT